MPNKKNNRGAKVSAAAKQRAAERFLTKHPGKKVPPGLQKQPPAQTRPPGWEGSFYPPGEGRPIRAPQQSDMEARAQAAEASFWNDLYNYAQMGWGTPTNPSDMYGQKDAAGNWILDENGLLKAPDWYTNNQRDITDPVSGEVLKPAGSRTFTGSPTGGEWGGIQAQDPVAPNPGWDWRQSRMFKNPVGYDYLDAMQEHAQRPPENYPGQYQGKVGNADPSLNDRFLSGGWGQRQPHWPPSGGEGGRELITSLLGKLRNPQGPQDDGPGIREELIRGKRPWDPGMGREINPIPRYAGGRGLMAPEYDRDMVPMERPEPRRPGGESKRIKVMGKFSSARGRRMKGKTPRSSENTSQYQGRRSMRRAGTPSALPKFQMLGGRF